MTAKGPWDRRFAFTAPFMVRMSMAFLRAIGKGGGNSRFIYSCDTTGKLYAAFYNPQKVVTSLP